VLRGYRSNEVPLPKVPTEKAFGKPDGTLKLDTTVKIGKLHAVDVARRPPVAVCLGPTVAGVSMPIPDLQNGNTALEGALYRFLRDIPHSKRPNKHFRKFVKMWVRHNLTPLAENHDLSFDTWIQNTPYSESRKAELRRAHTEIMESGKIKTEVKAFLKDEFYLDFKHARCINSRHDDCKVILGPYFQAITEKLFDIESIPWFIKKVPLPDRPDYIYNMMYEPGRYYVCTDYTSYESSFTKNRQYDCERILYTEMLRNHPLKTEFITMYDNGLIGTNNIKFKWFNLSVEAKRMSGEMNTSLGNGFSNLMFFLYIAKRLQLANPRGVVEGDDGLFRFDSSHSVNEIADLMKAEFVKLGLDIKIDIHTKLSHASFCGMIFDESDRTIIGNPLKIISSFGWTSAKYLAARPTIKNMLLRSKALSMAYQYPRCPLITELARSMLRLTNKCDVLSFLDKHATSFLDLYHLQIVKDAARADHEGKLILGAPGQNTRVLFEDLYGITVHQQLYLESYFSKLTDLKQLDDPVLYDLFPRRWKNFYDTYVDCVSNRDGNREYNAQTYTQLRPFVLPSDVM
jgi:hypothetical protein